MTKKLPCDPLPDENKEKTPEELLSEISSILQKTGERLSYSYGLPDLTDEQKAGLDNAQKDLESFTKFIQEQRTKILLQHADSLKGDTEKLRIAKKKLDDAVNTINEINELIHIGTQVAAIAAGMMM